MPSTRADFHRVAMACDGISFAVVLGYGLSSAYVEVLRRIPCAGLGVRAGFEAFIMLDLEEYQRGLATAAIGDAEFAAWAIRVHDQHRLMSEAIADAMRLAR